MGAGPGGAKRGGDAITGTDRAEDTFGWGRCDAPCSGSGAGRRTPQGKWALTPGRLAELQRVQDEVLEAALPFVAPGGTLVFATCSVLRAENEARVEAFLARHPRWQVTQQTRWPLDALGDGFFAVHLSESAVSATQL